MSDTTIEWADKTWNPLRGCSKVSEGCRNCYAIKTARRFHKEGEAFDGLTEHAAAGLNWTGKVMLVPGKLGEPFKWRDPKKVFVNSMSDLFHDAVPDEYIAQVFGIMWLAQKHTFMILTKRPERMGSLLNNEDFQFRTGWYASQAAREYGVKRPDHLPGWPNPNVWLGVSVENQKAADERIPLLLQTPAAIRFLSCEPLLGEVDFNFCKAWNPRDNGMYLEGIHWVIAGGESGPGARPMHPDWARSLRDQCQAAGVSFFFKQWGEWSPVHETKRFGPSVIGKPTHNFESNTTVYRIGKKLAGRELDGRTWDEFPEVTP